MEHLTKLKELMKIAIGDRTKKDFAYAAGLSQEYITRAMKDGPTSRPSRNTLKKIALASEGRVNYAELLDACGYDADKKDTEVLLKERKDLSVMERASKCAHELKEGFGRLGMNRPIYDDWNDYIEMVDMLYGVEKIQYSVGEERDFGDEAHRNADGSVILTAQWEGDGFSACFEVLVWFAKLMTGKLVILDTQFDKDSLGKAGSAIIAKGSCTTDTEACTAVAGKLVYSATTPLRVNDPVLSRASEIAFSRRVAANRRNGMDKQDAFLAALFGDANRKKRIMSVEGQGFYLDNIPEYVIKQFILSHHETFNRSEDEARILDGIQNEEPFADLFHHYKCDLDKPECGTWECAVANIMSRETGIPFTLWGTNELRKERDTLGNRPVLMLDASMPWDYNETVKKLTQKEFTTILDGYARELRSYATDVYYLMEVDIDSDDVL